MLAYKYEDMKGMAKLEYIIQKLKGRSIELPTVPKIKKVPVWFCASTDGNMIFIDKASNIPEYPFPIRYYYQCSTSDSHHYFF